MQANWWHHKLFHFLLPFWIWKVWKGREEITKTWTSWERKELFRWNKKTFFIVFEGLSFGEKNCEICTRFKNQIQNSATIRGYAKTLVSTFTDETGSIANH